MLTGLFIVAVALFITVTTGAIIYPGVTKPYSAVFTTNGEFYVGKLYNLPFASTMKLSHAFILQNVKSSATDAGNLQLIPLANSLWAPASIRFNKDNVVFTGRVNETSQIGQTIASYQNGTPAPATTGK